MALPAQSRRCRVVQKPTGDQHLKVTSLLRWPNKEVPATEVIVVTEQNRSRVRRLEEASGEQAIIGEETGRRHRPPLYVIVVVIIGNSREFAELKCLPSA